MKIKNIVPILLTTLVLASCTAELTPIPTNTATNAQLPAEMAELTLQATFTPTTTNTPEPPKPPHEIAPDFDTDDTKYKKMSSPDGKIAWYFPGDSTEATMAYDTFDKVKLTPEEAGRRAFITPDGTVLEVEYAAPVTIPFKDGILDKNRVTFTNVQDLFNYIFHYRGACYLIEDINGEMGLSRAEQAVVFHDSIQLKLEGLYHFSDFTNGDGLKYSAISIRQAFTPEGEEIVVVAFPYPIDPANPGKGEDLTPDLVAVDIVAYDKTWDEFFAELREIQ